MMLLSAQPIRALLSRKSRSTHKHTLIRVGVISLTFIGLLGCFGESESTVNTQKQVQNINPSFYQLDTPETMPTSLHAGKGAGKPVVYQVFTRLFGNTNETNIPWGTIEQNGVGKFNDFTDRALQGIAELGVSHIWYTGVPHHALVNDYTKFGISLDDPDVIKGRAGSPYAIKDYYNVNPDLAVDPANRLGEFEALIARTHANGLKVIIDIVPNHVARQYESISRPEGISNLGANDDISVEYARNNHFYYVPEESFKVPKAKGGYVALGGHDAPLLDGQFVEHPAKWTGNGARASQPDINDWYETVKVNYGVKPDGTNDFPSLPEGYDKKGVAEHYAFWQDKQLPNSWYQFHDIVHYWLEKGVDGFRYDMVEMVPSEFWSFLNSSIKVKYPDAFLLAEVYNPDLFREYLHIGKMDYLYDKVDFYDSLKAVMQGHDDTATLASIQANVSDIDVHMLHFLENHDEQRIASPEFAGDMHKGKPALVISALISKSPTMLYFGQEVGEDGSEETGFGDPSRTTIFDYAGVPAHQRWMNGGQFNGGRLSKAEKALRAYYKTIMNISANHPTMLGEYTSLHDSNLGTENYGRLQYSFVRHTQQRDPQSGIRSNIALFVVNNFDDKNSFKATLSVPQTLISQWQLTKSSYTMNDLINNGLGELRVTNLGADFDVQLDPLGSAVFEISWSTNHE